VGSPIRLTDDEGRTWEVGLSRVSDNGKLVTWRLTEVREDERAPYSFLTESAIQRVESAQLV
jgi:hypothetical protein